MVAPATDPIRALPETTRTSAARRDPAEFRPEQVRLLYAQSPAPLLASVFIAAVTAGVLAGPGPALPLLAWWVTLTVITVLRLWLFTAFRRQEPAQQLSGRWLTAYRLGGLAAGVAWGSLALFLDFGWPLSYQLLVYAMLVGVATAAVSNNGAVGSVYTAFLVPCLLPLTVRSLLAPEAVLVSMGVMLLILGVVLFSVSGSFEHTLLRSFALASDRARLLERVSRVNRELESETGDRMRAEAELLREKERAQVTLHSIGDGVVTTDTCGCVDYLNPSAERLTGWSLEEAKGQPLGKIYTLLDEATREPVGGLGETACQVDLVLQTREPQLLRRRDGEEFSVTQTVTPIRGPRGDTLGSVLVFRDVTETRSLARRLAYQASHDTVTGLLNRREFENRLAHALAVAQSESRQHICLYMDLDQFKIVNDTCGHAAGDDLLRQLAALMHGRLRESDALARLGGDEFGVLLEGCPLPQGIEIAEALRASVRDCRFLWEDKTFEIGVSIGIVAVTGERETVGSILSAADVACYAAKDLGRNRIHVYQDSDLDLARRHGEMQWVSRITQAIGEDRLELFCQDIVAVQTEDNLRHSVEILVRMRDERGELVSPAAFLPAAERYNLMPAIDRWVVHHCFRWLSSQPSLEGVLLSINLSGTTLSDDNFLAFIREQFERFRVPHDTVCFEITETAAIANQATASQFIRELRAMGCWFALDDFGSGLSSFAYLKNLPVDYLKIDGSFVRDMLHDPYDRAMVAAINEVGHRMGIRTIAEFVENRETLHALADLGVDYAQGWALGKPAPLREASAAAFRGAADQQLSA